MRRKLKPTTWRYLPHELQGLRGPREPCQGRTAWGSLQWRQSPCPVSRSHWAIQPILPCGNTSPVLPDLLIFFLKRSENSNFIFQPLNFKCWQGIHFVFQHVKGQYRVLQTKHDLGPLWFDCHLLDDLWFKHHPPRYTMKRQVWTKLSLSPQHHNSLQFFDYLKLLVSICASFQMLSFKHFRRIVLRYLTKKTLSCGLCLCYPSPLYYNLQVLSLIHSSSFSLQYPFSFLFSL